MLDVYVGKIIGILSYRCILSVTIYNYKEFRVCMGIYKYVLGVENIEYEVNKKVLYFFFLMFY